MASGERHGAQVARVPRGHDLAPGGGLFFDLRDEVGDLVDMSSVRRLPVAPLLAVDGAQLAVRVRPFVPDANAVFAQPRDVGLATQKPQQLDDDRTQMQLLGGHERKAGRQVEPHLVSENGQGTRSRAILLARTFVQDAPH